MNSCVLSQRGGSLRIMRADVQALLKKVAVRPNQDYTQQYPRAMPAKIMVPPTGWIRYRARGVRLPWPAVASIELAGRGREV
jgi:hypothetical protein